MLQLMLFDVSHQATTESRMGIPSLPVFDYNARFPTHEYWHVTQYGTED